MGERTQDEHWEKAGRIGYGNALFRSKRVERHVLARQWEVALDTARRLGIDEAAAVLELGCGDGEFAAEILGPRYRRVDAMDKSKAAIERAAARATGGNVRFSADDVTAYEYRSGDHWDGAFLIGFLHHVKPQAPSVIARLARVSPKVVVMEPNGDNLIRKLLENLRSYREAGEASFRLQELVRIFEDSGYRLKARALINLFPPFTPDALFPILRAAEKVVESSPVLRRLCSSYVLGFAREP